MSTARQRPLTSLTHSFTRSLAHSLLFSSLLFSSLLFMMTSSKGNIFRVTGPLCGEFTGPGEFPHKGQWRGALMFSLICVWMSSWANNREAGDLRRHRGNYDVNVSSPLLSSPPLPLPLPLSLSLSLSLSTSISISSSPLLSSPLLSSPLLSSPLLSSPLGLGPGGWIVICVFCYTNVYLFKSKHPDMLYSVTLCCTVSQSD